MTDHDRYLELAATSVDFPLSAEEDRELTSHLTTCRSCAQEAAGFRRDAQRVRTLAERDAPPRLRDEVWMSAVRPSRRRTSRPILLLAAAALLIGGLVAQSLSIGSPPTAVVDEGSADATPSPSPPATIRTPAPSVGRTAAPSAAAQPSSPASPAPSTVPPTPAGSFGTGLRWQAMTTGVSGSRRARMNGIARFRDRFIAVGEASGVGAVWASTDGQAWTGQVLPGAAVLVRIAAGPSGLVAVGGDQVWGSEDGDTWSRAPHPPAREAVLADVTTGPGGYAAVGRTALSSTTAAVWTSSDGGTWTRVPTQPAFESFCPTTVAWGPAGIVAVGHDCGEPGRGVVVSSADGVAWQRQSEAPFEGPIGAITVSDRRYVASAALEDPLGGVGIYISDDGTSWTRRKTFTSPASQESIVAITRVGSGYIAVGSQGEAGNDVATYVSRDGLNWGRGDILPMIADTSAEVTVTGVAAGDDRVVVVGALDPAAGDDGAATWTTEFP